MKADKYSRFLNVVIAVGAALNAFQASLLPADLCASNLVFEHTNGLRN